MKNNLGQALSNRPPYVGRNPPNVTPPHPLDKTFIERGMKLDSPNAMQLKADYDDVDLRTRKSRAFQLGMSVEQFDVAQRAYIQNLEARNPQKK